MSSHLHVREFGTGPAVLVLHATLVPADAYLDLATRLQRHYRVLLPYLPGYGDSPDPVDASFEATGAQLAAALAERGITELHGIVGYSSSAYRALHLDAVLRVKTRVIAGIGAFAHLDDQARAGFAGLADAIERDPSQLVGPLRDALVQANLSESWRASHPEDVDLIGQWLARARPAALVRELRAIASLPDLRDRLSSLRAKLYLRVGSADVTTPPEYSREIAARAADAVLEIVPGCGHALFLEDRLATSEAIERALRG